MAKTLKDILNDLHGEPITIELYNENDKTYLYVGTDNSSGAKYEVKTLSDVTKSLEQYLTDEF